MRCARVPLRTAASIRAMRPKVAARMEERDNLLRHRIDTGQVRAFTEIAAVTRECEIAVIVGPAMLAG